MKVKCKTRVSEGDKTYLPGEIILDIDLERVESLERSGAVERIIEPETEKKLVSELPGPEEELVSSRDSKPVKVEEPKRENKRGR